MSLNDALTFLLGYLFIASPLLVLVIFAGWMIKPSEAKSPLPKHDQTQKGASHE